MWDDEEELVMLSEIKDFKKEFRDLFPELKVYKQDHNDPQQQIDVLKDVCAGRKYAGCFLL